MNYGPWTMDYELGTGVGLSYDSTKARFERAVSGWTNQMRPRDWLVERLEQQGLHFFSRASVCSA